MKKGIFVLLVTIVGSALAYCLYFYCATQPVQAMLARSDGQMEWLRREFKLTDAQFTKVKQLHEAYRPGCDQMCLRIAEANGEANALISNSKTMTPEIEGALKKCATLQNECRQALLTHVYAVSSEMSPPEAHRYVDMMTARIVQPGLPPGSVVSQEPR
jgi:hypothetical protein